MHKPSDTDGALFEQLRPRLKALSWRILGSEAEAEDVVQDCFFKWQGARQEALIAPAAWLTTVVQRQAIDRLRQRLREAAAAAAALELADDTPPALPEDALLRLADLGEALTRLLACLSPAERMALVLHEALECEHAAIAAALRTNAVNARQHLARARRRLRQEPAEAPLDEKRGRELVRRFQAAINGRDVATLATLLADEQPVSLHETLPQRTGASACANDCCYAPLLTANSR